MQKIQTGKKYTVTPKLRSKFEKINGKLFANIQNSSTSISTVINKPDIGDIILSWSIVIDIVTDVADKKLSFDDFDIIIEDSDKIGDNLYRISVDFLPENDNIYMGVHANGTGTFEITNCFVEYVQPPAISNIDYIAVQDMTLGGTINEQIDYFVIQDIDIHGAINEQVDYFVIQDINTNIDNSERVKYFIIQDIIKAS